GLADGGPLAIVAQRDSHRSRAGMFPPGSGEPGHRSAAVAGASAERPDRDAVVAGAVAPLPVGQCGALPVGSTPPPDLATVAAGRRTGRRAGSLSASGAVS